MSSTLYRKYRPQTFKELTGQNHVKVTLQHELEKGTVAHAYLLCGPRGVGKTTTARLLAKAVNCEKRSAGESEPCNTCASCSDFNNGRDLDIVEIDAASHTGVDNVRENIIQNARVTPTARKFKVFIIDEVHMLSISAFNALLKLLEEPPAHALFILCTTESHKIPATIISRCQRFDFKRIPTHELVERLSWMCEQEGVRVDAQVLADIARHAEGGLRDAESLLGQVLAMGEKNITRDQAELVLPHSRYDLVIQFLTHLGVRNAEASIRLVNDLVEQGVAVPQFIADTIETLRKVLLSKVNSGLRGLSLELDDELEKQLMDIGAKVTEQEVISLIELMQQAREEIKFAVLVQLPLELAIVTFIYGTGAAVVSAPAAPVKPSPAPARPSVIPMAPVSAAPVGKKYETKKEADATRAAAAPTGELPASVTIEFIRSSWHRFLVALQENNASLTFILKVAEPVALDGNKLTIGFKYSFHKKRIDEQKITRIVENELARVFGGVMLIKTDMLPADYESPMIAQETKTDEVEFVSEVPPAPDESMRVSVTESILAGEPQELLGGSAEKKSDATQPATTGMDPTALVTQLVNAFGGKIVE